MTDASLADTLAGCVAILQEIDGIGTVIDRDGGKSTWAETPAEGQTYWIVGHESTSVRLPGVTAARLGMTTLRRTRRIRVDGWSPWSYESNTAAAWRDWLNTVLLKLSRNVALGVCARMLAPPELKLNRLELYSSLHQSDQSVLCHHATFGFDVVLWDRTFQT